MSCLDCEDKSKKKNEVYDALRSIHRVEPMAIVMIEDSYDVVPVNIAMSQGLIIKEVLMPN